MSPGLARGLSGHYLCIPQFPTAPGSQSICGFNVAQWDVYRPLCNGRSVFCGQHPRCTHRCLNRHFQIKVNTQCSRVGRWLCILPYSYTTSTYPTFPKSLPIQLQHFDYTIHHEPAGCSVAPNHFQGPRFSIFGYIHQVLMVLREPLHLVILQKMYQVPI